MRETTQKDYIDGNSDGMTEGLRFEDILVFFKCKKHKKDKGKDDEDDKGKDDEDDKGKDDEDGKGKGDEDDKKEIKRVQRVAMIWRVINWFIVWTIDCALINYLFKYTYIGFIAYIMPGIPWVAAVNMVLFFVYLNIAINASSETNKDRMRFRSAIVLSAIPTAALMFAGEMGLINLFIAGCISFSVWREKIYTDAKVRRTPHTKERTDFKRNKEGDVTSMDKYQV